MARQTREPVKAVPPPNQGPMNFRPPLPVRLPPTPRSRPFGASLLLLPLSLLAGTASAQESAPTDPIVVGTRHVPPFAVRAEDGTWGGVTIELWRWIAADLDLEFGLKEVPLEDSVRALRDGEVDVVAAALTVTADREEAIDFSHPFLSTGLGILVPRDRGTGIAAVAAQLLGPEFVGAFGGLLVVLLAVGLVVWLFERRRNPEQFGGGPARGVGSGLWWSAVTLTTVGYGDKAPVTAPGRLVAVVWMFAGLFLISSFTAAVASAWTVARLGSSITGPEDLAGRTVAAVRGSTSEAWLTRRGIRTRAQPSVEEALAAVVDGRAQAMVHDAPILRWLATHRDDRDLVVVPGTFEPQEYGLGLPEGSALMEQVNRRLLRHTSSDEWRTLLRRTFGE